MKSNITYSIVALLTLSACGGSSNDGPDIGAENAFCDHPYFQTIIGDYSGQAFFTIPTDSDNRAVSCTWEITLSIRHQGNPVVCDLVFNINAPVTQTIILEGDDPLAHQCFDEISLRDIRDSNNILTAEELSAVPYPVSLIVNTDPGVSRFGPYFDDDNFRVPYERIFDNGNVRQILVDGLGGIEFETFNGSSIPFEGSVQRVEDP